MTEYRLVAGVLGIIFDEHSDAEAKRQFDLLVINPKPHDLRRLERKRHAEHRYSSWRKCRKRIS